MKPSRRKRLFSLAILCVLVYSFLFGTSLALADEPTPPVSTEETTPPPVDEQPDEPDPEGQPPVDEPSDPAESDEEFLASEESDELPAETVEETPTTVPDKAGESTDDAPDGDEEADDEPGLLDSLPADTSVVVVVDGQIEPLATQEAADALVNGDPVWCPAGVTPGNDPSGACTDSFGSFNSVGGVPGLLVDDATNKDLHDVSGPGTIYVQSGAVADTNSIIINGNTFTGLQTFELTIQGGWDFVTNTLSSTPSIFSSQIRVVNWQNDVTINDISVSNTTSNGLTVTTTGDINLHNVTSSGNSNGHGAVLNNSSGSGDIRVTGNSDFSNNSGSGLVATSNGDITLQDVIASNNIENGASLRNNGGSGTITLNGTNTFNGNTLSGLRAVSNGDITSATSLTATGNGNYGALFNTTGGWGNVSLNGTNTFSNNTYSGLNIRAGGSISLENITANDNQDYGAYLYNRNGNNGSITLSGTSVFNHNASSGLAAYSDGDITLRNLTAGADAATGNGAFGVLVNNSTGAGNVALSGTNLFTNNTSDGLRIVSSGNIVISGTLTASDNDNHGAFLNNSADITFTGTSTFNGNASNGLRISSAGNVTSTTSLTANDNDRYGVLLDNTAGPGSVTLSGTNTFSGNTLSGLRALSNGAVSLANVTANNNGVKGNPDFRHGVFVDNSTGTAGVTLSGTNTFNGNYATGLFINSKGDVAINNVTASNNGGYGAHLDNSAGAGSVYLTGTDHFDHNALDGLKIASSASISNTGTLSGNQNQGNGINIAAGGAVDLQNITASGNLLRGVQVTAGGDIDIYNANASDNGQDGFSLQTDGTSSLRCSSAENNGAYGVHVVKNKALYLYGVSFSGNVLGDLEVDGGRVVQGGCSGALEESSYVGGKNSIQVVSVSQAAVQLSCELHAGTRLALPNGDFVYIPCPIGEMASLGALAEGNLPGALPEGSRYHSGFTFALMAGEQSLEQVEGLMTLSFVIPDGTDPDDLAILFWDGSQWVDVSGASRTGNRFEAQVNFTGSFILVNQ